MPGLTEEERIGRMIRDSREAKGLTQAALAKQCGVTRQAISVIESGRRTPGRPLAIRLSAYLNIPISMFKIPGLDPVNPDTSLQAMISLWDKLSEDQRLQMVEYALRLAREHLAERS